MQERCREDVSARHDWGMQGATAVVLGRWFIPVKDAWEFNAADRPHEKDSPISRRDGRSRFWDSGRMGRISVKFAHLGKVRDKIKSVKKFRPSLNF